MQSLLFLSACSASVVFMVCLVIVISTLFGRLLSCIMMVAVAIGFCKSALKGLPGGSLSVLEEAFLRLPEAQ